MSHSQNIDLSTLPGLCIEKTPSGATRIRVRDLLDPTKRITLPNGLTDEQFIDAYHRARNGIATPKERNHFEYLCSHKGFTRAIGDMIVGARQRAQLRQCDFTITREDLISRLEAQRGLCAVTGVPFSLAGKLKGAKRPNRMSVDSDR